MRSAHWNAKNASEEAQASNGRSVGGRGSGAEQSAGWQLSSVSGESQSHATSFCFCFCRRDTHTYVHNVWMCMCMIGEGEESASQREVEKRAQTLKTAAAICFALLASGSPCCCFCFCCFWAYYCRLSSTRTPTHSPRAARPHKHMRERASRAVCVRWSRWPALLQPCFLTLPSLFLSCLPGCLLHAQPTTIDARKRAS